MDEINMQTSIPLNPEKLYRLYEYDADAEFPDLSMPCGTLDNYIRTGILTEEEVRSLLEPGRSACADTASSGSRV